MPEPFIQVRPAVASDVEAIARVHIRSWQRAYRGQIPDRVLDSLDEKKRAERCLAELEGNASGLLVALYVHPDRWRGGAGSALIGEALKVANGRRYRCAIGAGCKTAKAGLTTLVTNGRPSKAMSGGQNGNHD